MDNTHLCQISQHYAICQRYQEYYEYESEYILPIPTRLGYSFKGWTENPNFENPSVIDRIPIVYEEDVTLTAVWEKVTYTIDYVFGKHMYSNYKQLYRAFFSDFYYYIKDYRGAEYSLIKSVPINCKSSLVFLNIFSSHFSLTISRGISVSLLIKMKSIFCNT